MTPNFAAARLEQPDAVPLLERRRPRRSGAALPPNDSRAGTVSLLDAPEFKGEYNGGDSPRLIPSLGMYTGMGEAVGAYRSHRPDALLGEDRTSRKGKAVTLKRRGSEATAT